MGPIGRYWRLLSFALCTLIAVSCSAVAQDDQRPAEPQNPGAQHGQAAGNDTSAVGGHGEPRGAATNSPFGPASEAAVGNAVKSPFDLPATNSTADVVGGAFDVQSGAREPSGAGAPFEQPAETPTGSAAVVVSSPFDQLVRTSSEAEGDQTHAVETKPAEGLDASGQAVERPLQRDSSEEKAETLKPNDASHQDLFGDSYLPRLAGDASPAFSGGEWSPWYSAQGQDGSHLADVDIAYRRGVGQGEGESRDLPTAWMLRNRSGTTLTIRYELDIQCVERCKSGWHSYRAVIPAGESARGGNMELWQVRSLRVREVSPSDGRKVAGRSAQRRGTRTVEKK